MPCVSLGATSIFFSSEHIPDLPACQAESGDEDSVFFVRDVLPRVVYALLRRR